MLRRLSTACLIAALLVDPRLALADEAAASEASVGTRDLVEAEVAVPKLHEMITDIPSNLKTWGIEAIEPQNIPVTIGVLATTAILTATDFETWQAARIPQDRSSTVREFANRGTSMGDGYFQFAIVGAFAATGAVAQNDRALRTASQITEAILSTGIIVQVVKHITGRESPFTSESRTGVWRFFANQYEYHRDFQNYDAVPSGHLSTAVTTFVVIQDNYPDQKWISYIGWPIMGWISYGLVATSIHWWSDFPIAIATGYSIAKIVTRSNFKKPGVPEQSSIWRPTLLPSVSGRGEPMLTAGWTF